MTGQTFAFGSFRLDPNRRALREGGRLLHMGSRALDILIALVENAGETLTRGQLVERVWPNTVVGDASLRVHVAGLRKVLADGQDGHRFIVNVPGRGYTFVAPVIRQATGELPPVEAAIESHGNMPTSLARVIGREAAINALLERQTRNRLVTILGPGGIGKTTVAIAVATAAAPQYAHGAWFVSLASLADPALVPAAVASSLGASISNVDAMLALTGWLRDRNALIVLDSCEHVIGAAAALAEVILRAAPRVRILATSREGLHARTEWRYRLAPLAVPPAGEKISIDDALNYSAFNLFYQCAVATKHDINISDDEVPAAVEICRRLDGVPLALELAASSVEMFGLRALARGLDDRFSVLTVGRRTALPRHRTLRATMDWSYELLTPDERIILCRLAVFLGDFTMDDAAAVAGDATIRAADVYEGIASLGAKSLLTTDISGDTTYLRLLDTTRAYALEKLGSGAEIGAMQAAHALHYATMLAAEAHDGRVDCRREIDNIRAALRWASGPAGDRALFVRLAAVSAPCWLALSLLTECAAWMAKAIAELSPSERGTRTEMCLCSALGFAMMFTTGMTDAAYGALAHALELAESVGDLDYQMRNMFALSVFLLRRPDFKAALALAHQCQSVAAHVADPMARPTADWMLGLSQFCLGDIANGRANMERVRDLYRPVSRRAELVRFGFDQRVYAMGIVGLARWIEGFPEQAIAQSQLSIDEAEAVEHPVSLCVALWTGCLVSLWVGDAARLRRLTEGLLLHTDRHGLRNYHAYGLGFDGELACLQGDFVRGMTLMRASIDGLRQARHLVFHSVFLSALAKQTGAGGDVAGGLTLVDEALERAEQSDERWFMPELLRIKAGLLLLGDPSSAEVAEALFTRSLALAESLGGRSWRLRTAIDLGRLWLRRGHRIAARDLLAPMLADFSEGLDSVDPQAARALLEELG